MIMNDDVLYRLWGKTNEREKGYDVEKWDYHPAICHMIDVGYVAEVWLDLNKLIMDRFCKLAPGIPRDDLRKIIVTIVALHDLGKVHRNFQAKSELGWNSGYGSIGAKRPGDHSGFDHGCATAGIMAHVVSQTLPEWKRWQNAIDLVAAHHGKFYTDTDLGRPRFQSLNVVLDQPVAIIAVEVLSLIFDTPKELPPAPTSSGFGMFLAGFASVADWFGSNSEVYPFSKVSSVSDLQDYLAALRSDRRAEKQLHDSGLIPTYRTENLNYGSLFPFLSTGTPLRPLQEKAQEIPFGEMPGSELVAVEAPMGMGKTEIALFLAARALSSGHADGIYFALPTQASSNALLERIGSYAEHVRDPDREISIAMAHGGSRYNKEFQKTRERTRKLQMELERVRANHGTNGDQIAVPSEVIAPSWLQSSKRALLASIGVGTIDQAMLGAISVKHAFVRLFALAGKVVVFDEIHAYDSYMNVVIEHLLRWLHVLDAKVILLSATLPRTLRERLIATYTESRLADEVPPEQEPYPQIVHCDVGGGIQRFDLDQDKGSHEETSNRPINIAVIESSLEDRTQRGALQAIELIRSGGCVAWIRNTVREAQEAWETVVELVRDSEGGEDVEVVLLHARYVRADRNKIEENLVSVLGRDPKPKRPSRMIVIATQVIEQSVDIDFDAMISDLAPVDLLLQRAGRLWRHERGTAERQGHTERTLHVLVPNADALHDMEFGSSSYVYDEETLARTSTLVHENPVWLMPDACRTLVARLYDYNATEWTAERMNVDETQLENARGKQSRLNRSMSGDAKRILMPKPGRRSLTMEVGLSDDDRGDNVALATRYGGSSATAVLLYADGDQIRLAGAPDVVVAGLPDPSKFGEILDLEEKINLSIVSFPWYDRLQPATNLPEIARALEAWWSDRHPYDHKVFLAVSTDGTIEHPQFSGRYLRDSRGHALNGLVIEKNHKKRSEEELVHYEKL